LSRPPEGFPLPVMPEMPNEYSPGLKNKIFLAVAFATLQLFECINRLYLYRTLHRL